jgi:hypothetical protein
MIITITNKIEILVSWLMDEQRDTWSGWMSLRPRGTYMYGRIPAYATEEDAVAAANRRIDRLIAKDLKYNLNKRKFKLVRIEEVITEEEVVAE